MSNEFRHYGILRKSGRYPWGSGKDAYSRSRSFYQYIDEMRAKGLRDKEIAQAIGVAVRDLTKDPNADFSIAQLRSTRTIAKEQIIAAETAEAIGLRDKQMSVNAIAEKMGIPPATVRLRLASSEKLKKSALLSTADLLRENVQKHQIVDIGKGTEHNIGLGIADTKLRAAVAVLQDEGYVTYNLQVRQPGSKHMTNQKVLVPPGTTFGEAKRMTDKIHTLGEWTEDGGLTYLGIHEPLSINSKRLKVRFAEDGGALEDGTIWIRPGVKDLDMGANTYAQVRIAIDNDRYVKGMAIVRDDLPEGIDIVFNTNKSKDVGKLGALKAMKDDPDNPFGSVIKRQIVKVDPKTGKEKVTSAINLLREEGDWDMWHNSLPSQMLAKQPNAFIKTQLEETRRQTQQRLADIQEITNPIVRQKALQTLADKIDSDAVELRAAAMPRQRTQVILPLPNINKNEIYAPNFESGERVALIRYPHGGPFEIAEVTVNNGNRTAKKLIGNAPDAIGVHPAVAERLSGADFDGDTAIVIPNPTGRIKGSKSMGSAAAVYEAGLANFDPKRRYGGYKVLREATDTTPEIGNFKKMTNTGSEMGKITNLITDMSVQGARPEHIVRAVRHSMVVIDAEKHELNYKQSAIDNGIAQLKTLYQGSAKAGASTLLSRATASTEVLDMKPRSAKNGGPIDLKTGARVYEETGKPRSVYDKKTGTYLDEKVPATIRRPRLSLTDDAYTLVRDRKDPVESLYADHVNMMKGFANKTRLAAVSIPNPPVNVKAKQEYKAEIDDLVTQLKAAQKQKPLDRRARVVAGATVKAKLKDDPTLHEDRERKAKVERQALAAARARLGLKKPTIEISDRAWDAIQSGGVSSSRLREILEYADPKRVDQLARPRPNAVMSSAVLSRARAMLSAGNSPADVARSLGVAPSTLTGAIKRGEL